jgi:signal transduction histidine kinase/CheY-like chemotaxis protein
MQPSETRERRSSGHFAKASRTLLVLASLTPLLLFAGFAWFDYEAEVSRARDNVAKTTIALGEHVQKVVETADLVLARVLDHVQGNDWETIAHSRSVHDFLAGLKSDLPQVESVFLVSPEGVNAASSRGFPLPLLSDTTRDYFVAAAQGNVGLFVSAPFKGQLAGTYAFTITRPRMVDGRFDGLAGVTVSPAYFEAFYRAMLDDSGASATALVRTDGALLVRFPPAGGRDPFLPATSALMRAAASGAAFSLFTSRSRIDGRLRLTALKRLDGVPLMISYALDRNLYLRGWYYNVAAVGGLAALLSGTILLVGHSLLVEAAREREALRRLLEETQRRREAEAALQHAQKLEALGRLTGGVAHDFNNLLTAILGSLELLQKHVAGARPERLIATARQAAQRGAQLTAQMLAFARKQEVAIRSIDVNATIRGMTELIHGAIGPTITLRQQLADTLVPVVADPLQLEIALLNLAVNARDAMANGGELTLATEAVAISGREAEALRISAGAYARIAVSDTGEGMPEAVRAHVLEPFFTTKGPGIGTGLGLSMVFGFASLMGGTVTVQSAPGEGTTINIYLPQDTAGAGETRRRPETPAPAIEIVRPRGGTVLLVDDDEMVRMTTRQMLEDLAQEVVEAVGGGAALAILESERMFDLAIVDFAMPEMNGGRCATEIRRLRPDMPLLFITGYVENDDLRPWTALGVPTLRKPFTRDTLAAAMAEATGRPRRPAQAIAPPAGSA